MSLKQVRNVLEQRFAEFIQLQELNVSLILTLTLLIPYGSYAFLK